MSFWGLGRAVARLLIVPEYERLLDVHVAALKSTAEERAARRRRDARKPPVNGGTNLGPR